jgi:hypothetical protein
MRVTVISFLILSILLISLASANDEQKNKPVLFMETLINDLGKVFEQDNYQYLFKVQNKGKADLLIENVKPG